MSAFPIPCFLKDGETAINSILPSEKLGLASQKT